MKCITEKKFVFAKKNIWFADEPFDVDDCDAVYFYATRKNVDAPGFKKTESTTLVIDLTRGLDAVWSEMKKIMSLSNQASPKKRCWC